jgi:hypothetical protein
VLGADESTSRHSPHTWVRRGSVACRKLSCRRLGFDDSLRGAAEQKTVSTTVDVLMQIGRPWNSLRCGGEDIRLAAAAIGPWLAASTRD